VQSAHYSTNLCLLNYIKDCRMHEMQDCISCNDAHLISQCFLGPRPETSDQDRNIRPRSSRPRPRPSKIGLDTSSTNFTVVAVRYILLDRKCILTIAPPTGTRCISLATCPTSTKSSNNLHR